MRNVSDNIFIENKKNNNFGNFLPKIMPFTRQCGKVWQSHVGRR
jgi:hypothetical protein